MATDKSGAGVAPTKSDCYGIYTWAVDVTVQPGWDERQDRQYALEVIGADSSDEVIEQICHWMPSFPGMLTYAFCFLTATLYAPGERLFDSLPIKSKVAILKALFHRWSQDPGYLERFDCDLRRFLDVETICMPVLERYYLDPKAVWLRELVEVHDAGAFANLAESLACEHENCAHFLTPADKTCFRRPLDRCGLWSRHGPRLRPGSVVIVELRSRSKN